MLSRGYEGVLPHDEPSKVQSKVWITAMIYPMVAAIILITQLVIGTM
jgi:hypothetical protein